jgi:hypothetical protein
VKRVRWKTLIVLLIVALILPPIREAWWSIPAIMIVGFCLPPLFPEFDD